MDNKIILEVLRGVLIAITVLILIVGFFSKEKNLKVNAIYLLYLIYLVFS